MTVARKIRGSELLARKWTESDLIKLIDIEHDGVSLVEFFPKGVPVPDGGWGTWNVPASALTGFLQSVLKGQNVPNLQLFPRGIPPVVDHFDVTFSAGSAVEH
jgi:hypothetical protein